MKPGFEKPFTDIQKDMISACVDYVGGRADVCYIYAAYENKALSCEFFYRIGGTMYRKHKLPTALNCTADKQIRCLRTMNEYMKKLIGVCQEYEAAMPTQIKLTYSIKTNKVNADYCYDPVAANSKLGFADIAQQWFEELEKQ